MAKPNYQFEKRQRDIAKKKKQDEKRSRKLTKDETASAENPEVAPEGGAPAAGDSSAD
jgi:hypothetical protein